MSVLLGATGHQVMRFKRQMRLQPGVLFEEEDIVSFSRVIVSAHVAWWFGYWPVNCEAVDHGDRTVGWCVQGHLHQLKPRSDYTECWQAVGFFFFFSLTVEILIIFEGLSDLVFEERDFIPSEVTALIRFGLVCFCFLPSTCLHWESVYRVLM